MYRIQPTWLTTIVVATCIGACQSAPTTRSTDTDNATISDSLSMSSEPVASDRTEASPQTFSGHGVIKNITPSKTYVVIQHGPIAGFMGAMTMPFELRDQKLLGGVAVGDSIAFTLTSTRTSTWLSKMVKAE